jgi:hypothetical protein
LKAPEKAGAFFFLVIEARIQDIVRQRRKRFSSLNFRPVPPETAKAS